MRSNQGFKRLCFEWLVLVCQNFFFPTVFGCGDGDPGAWLSWFGTNISLRFIWIYMDLYGFIWIYDISIITRIFRPTYITGEGHCLQSGVLAGKLLPRLMFAGTVTQWTQLPTLPSGIIKHSLLRLAGTYPIDRYLWTYG